MKAIKPEHVEKLGVICQILKYSLELESTSQITGIKDTSEKILACYLSRKYTGIRNSVIANYFQINDKYMISCIENLAIELLLNSDTKSEIEKMGKLYKSLMFSKL